MPSNIEKMLRSAGDGIPERKHLCFQPYNSSAGSVLFLLLLLLFAFALFCVVFYLSLKEKDLIKEINGNQTSTRCMKHVPR